MGKVDNVLAEVSMFLNGCARRDVGIASGGLEPRGGKVVYTPEADNRLVGMMTQAKVFTRSDYARVKRVFDELDPRVCAVLKIASSSTDSLHADLGAMLPEARVLATENGCDVEVARQRVRALNEYRLDDAYSRWRRDGASPITIAMRVLEFERELELQVTLAVVTEQDLAIATRLAIEMRVIDVRRETSAIVEAACDAYLAMRDELGATKRAQKAETARLLDELLGKKRRKEAAKTDARLRRRAAEVRRAS